MPAPESQARVSWFTAARDRRAPWLWALGGAVAASALWAGGLAGWHATHPDGPDLHGYALGSHNLCALANLAPLLGTAHLQPFGNSPTDLRTPALDRSGCGASTTVTASGDHGLNVYVSVALHKRTDPGPEFRSERTGSTRGAQSAAGLGTPKIVNVHGLGDEAYLLATAPDQVSLHVQHGGLVCVLNLMVTAPNTTSAMVFTTGSDAAYSTAGATADTTTSAADEYGPRLIATARRIMADLASR